MSEVVLQDGEGVQQDRTFSCDTCWVLGVGQELSQRASYLSEWGAAQIK